MKQVLISKFNNYLNYNSIFFYQDKILVKQVNNSPLIKFTEGLNTFNVLINTAYVYRNIMFVPIEISDSLNSSFLKEDYKLINAKVFLRETTNSNVQYLIRGIQWLSWEKKYRYCSTCGENLIKVKDLLEKKCSKCNLIFYPNLSPAIIVLIQRDNEILLARNAHFREGMYSLVAGFVEIGESAEDAVHREVMEEVGIKITALDYFGSQSWPFPSSFMIAYKAKYLSGEIKIDYNEIQDAKWFNINNLPYLPYLPSISRSLLDSVTNL